MATDAEMDAAIGVLAQAIEDGVIDINDSPPEHDSTERNTDHSGHRPIP